METPYQYAPRHKRSISSFLRRDAGHGPFLAAVPPQSRPTVRLSIQADRVSKRSRKRTVVFI